MLHLVILHAHQRAGVGCEAEVVVLAWSDQLQKRLRVVDLE